MLNSATVKPQWEMNAWYATNDANGVGHAEESKDVAVSPGDKMYGSVFRNNIKNSQGQYQWTIFIKDITTGKYIIFKQYVKANNFNFAQVSVMESYDVTRCGSLAGSPFSVTDYHTYDSAGKEMYTNQLGQFNYDTSCNVKITQNTAKHSASISSDGNY